MKYLISSTLLIIFLYLILIIPVYLAGFFPDYFPWIVQGGWGLGMILFMFFITR